MTEIRKHKVTVDGREIDVRDFKFLHEGGAHPWRGPAVVDSLPTRSNDLLRNLFIEGEATRIHPEECMTDPFNRPGTTTKQMQEAPKGATYIWPISWSLSYARALAHHLGRSDLNIVGPSAVDRPYNLAGLAPGMLIADHACWEHFTGDQAHRLQDMLDRRG